MKPLLSENDSRRIAAAVAEAEKKSGGEIATAVIAESDDYGFRELVFALIVGFIVFTAAALMDSRMEAFFFRPVLGFQSRPAAFYLQLDCPVLRRPCLFSGPDTWS